jgi:hypothetical protein
MHDEFAAMLARLLDRHARERRRLQALHDRLSDTAAALDRRGDARERAARAFGGGLARIDDHEIPPEVRETYTLLRADVVSLLGSPPVGWTEAHSRRRLVRLRRRLGEMLAICRRA